MKSVILKATFSAALSTLTMSIHAAEPAAATGASMHGSHQDCSGKMKDMHAMKGMEHGKMDCDKHGAGHAATISTGVIQEIDKTGKMITLKHGPIKNMNMPAMTMSFRVRDAAMLRTVKVGESVNFTVENIGNAPTVTTLRKK